MNSEYIYKSVRTIKVFFALVFLMASALGHAADPTQQPLLDSSDITYVGSFKLPTPTSGTFAYGGMALAVSEDGKTLYVGGHVYDQSLGRVTIPDPIGGTAKLVQSPVKIPGSVGSGSTSLAGALVFNNRLIVQKLIGYDTNGTGNTHAAGTSNISNFNSFTRLANIPSAQFANGYMGIIPPEWQSLLGGPAFTGNSVMSINSLCSNGPSFFAFNPNDVGVKSPIPSTPLMYYPLSNPLANPGSANDLFSRADQSNAGIVFPSGTRSILFFSRHGYGSPTYKQDDGCGGSGGEGAAPYRRQITAFDANDLLAVKNGTKQPWEIRPYAWWVVPGPSDRCADFQYSGLAYDPHTRRVFATLGYGESPEVHVWQVSGDTGNGNPASMPPSPPQDVQVQ